MTRVPFTSLPLENENTRSACRGSGSPLGLDPRTFRRYLTAGDGGRPRGGDSEVWRSVGSCSPCISRAGHHGAADRRALPSSAPPSSAGSATADGYQAFARPSQGPRLGPTSGSGPVWRAAHLRRRPRHVRQGPTLHSCSFHLAWGEQVLLGTRRPAICPAHSTASSGQARSCPHRNARPH